MKKTGLIFPFLKILFTEPSVIFKSLYHTVNIWSSRKSVIKNFDGKKGLPEIDLLELFPGFDETVNPFSHLYGTSLPVDLAVLRKLAKRFDSCEYLEIGSWRGESLANVSPLCKRCVSVSLSGEEMRNMGMNEKMIQMQKFFSRKLSNIEHIEANSRVFDFSPLGKFDLIFVDGDHSAEGVKNDTQKVFQLLKDKNSIIVWHDYVANYEHINWEVYHGILSGAPETERGKIYHISNTLCAIYMNGNLKTQIAEYPAQPVNNFTIRISGEKIP